jgi:ammonium transporter, Amt family
MRSSTLYTAGAVAIMAVATAAVTQCMTAAACTEAEIEQKIQEAVQAFASAQTADIQTRRLLDSPHTGTWPGAAASVAEKIAATNKAMDTMWLLICAILVFFMQCGFAMVEAGAVRHGSVKSILFKNLLDPCFAALVFWAFGYGFAYGASDEPNVFIGDKLFFLTNFESVDSYANFFFQFAFAATAATIVSGAVAERCKIEAFFMYNILLTGFVYPVVVHWVWSFEGFLSAWNPGVTGKLLADVGMVDFAGCGVVHMVGGLAGLIGASVLGPRSGEWKKYGTHNAPLVCFGTFILWVGWFGFNCGSTLLFNGGDQSSHLASKVAVTTVLSAAASGITSCFIWNKLGEAWSIERTCNGILAGLVGVTAACSVIECWAAIVGGICSAFIYTGASIFVKEKLGIDDVLDAAAVHFFCGIWGLLVAALFASKEALTLAAYPEPQIEGLFYGGDFKRLGVALAGILAITAWVTAIMLPFFMMLDKQGMFRVSFEAEVAGIDKSEMGGDGYNYKDEPDRRTMVKRNSWSSKKGESAENNGIEMGQVVVDATPVSTTA